MLNAWGTERTEINADIFCQWCERPNVEGHYDNCTRNTPEALDARLSH